MVNKVRPKGHTVDSHRSPDECPVCSNEDVLAYLKECLIESQKHKKLRPSPDTLHRHMLKDFMDAGYLPRHLPSRYALRKHFGTRSCAPAKLYRDWVDTE